MKKLLILAALAALALGACTKNEVVTNGPGDEVSFSVYTGRAVTKATNVIGIDTLKRNGFGVFAFYTGQNTFATAKPSTPNFMNNQKVAFKDGKWAYDPIKYWPNNSGDKVSFFAYAPYNSAKTWSADSTVTFEVNNAVLGQVDFLFAPPKKDQTKQTGKDSLGFTFKHALSKVGLKVAYVRDSTTYEKANGAAIEDSTMIVIDSVILIPVDGFYKEGKINMMKDTATWTATALTTKKIDSLKFGNTANFKRDSAAVTGKRPAGQIVTATLDTLNNDNSYMMIIPQNFSTNGINVVVKYHVWTRDKGLADGVSKVTNRITTNFKPTFLPGKQYFLNLLLGINSVKIKAEVAPWYDGTDSDIYLPANN